MVGKPATVVVTAALAAGAFAAACTTLQAGDARAALTAQAAYSAPAAPTGVTAKVVAGGVRVRWTPAAPANPAVTNYVVHAGPGSCPVTVGPRTTSVVMPIARGRPRPGRW